MALSTARRIGAISACTVLSLRLDSAAVRLAWEGEILYIMLLVHARTVPNICCSFLLDNPSTNIVLCYR